MSEVQVLGYLTLAVITLGSFVTVIIKFTQPLNDLKLVIQELRDCVNALREDRDEIRLRIDKHGNEIDDLKVKVGKIQTKIDVYHKE